MAKLRFSSPTYGPRTRETVALTVEDLILPETGEWNRDLIQSILPFEEERILRLKPSMRGAPDSLRWLGSKNGEYSVKTGYHVAMAELTEEILAEEATPEFDWRKTVWNLKLAPKVKMFTWKCLKGIIPVGERLLVRHINVDPRCKRCGSSESINHLLFHCSFARDVWNLSPLAGSFDVSGLTDLRADWSAMHALNCLPPTGITNTPLVPWILWSLWKSRNKLVFENFAGNPADTISQAITSAKEWTEAQEQCVTKAQAVHQAPPLQVATVARSDAAWSETTQTAGLGWIVMNQEQRTTGKKEEPDFSIHRS